MSKMNINVKRKRQKLKSQTHFKKLKSVEDTKYIERTSRKVQIILMETKFVR